jgi:soluble lytic murein transglycosylase
MQLIPGTAQAQARREGMTYQRASLTGDPQYNMTLGSAHLADLIDDFNGSYVLAIAAYNAGSHRAREWIGDWGDPRSRSVDVVDWVELIPFAETRNYVQRVTENLQVYRYRLAGAPTPITLESDLQRGRY